MLVEPLPGVGLERLREKLWELEISLNNAHGAGGSAVDKYNRYVAWVHDAVRHLATMVHSVDLEYLVLTRRYWVLQEQASSAALQPILQLVVVEFEERRRAFRDAVEAVDAEIERWAHPGVLVMPDTSFYITHPEKLEEVDVAALLSLRDEPIRLVVPILVIDELDQLKRSGDIQTRWRAPYTLAVLDRVLTSTKRPCRLHEANFEALKSGGIPRGEVTVEVLFDPPRHERLPIADDEIVARAAAAQTRAGRAIRVVTYDTGQYTRARHAGLDALKLARELPPEPKASRRKANERRSSGSDPAITG